MKPRKHPDYPITVHPDGSIWLDARITIRKDGKPYPCGGSWATAHRKHPQPYFRVTVPAGRRPKATRFVHQLVAEAFHGPRPPGHHAMHRDDHPETNRWDNIVWGTPKQNMATRKACRGPAHHAARLTVTKVQLIRQEHAVGVDNCTLARRYKITPTAVRAVWKRKSWAWVP